MPRCTAGGVPGTPARSGPPRARSWRIRNAASACSRLVATARPRPVDSTLMKGGQNALHRKHCRAVGRRRCGRVQRRCAILSGGGSTQRIQPHHASVGSRQAAVIGTGHEIVTTEWRGTDRAGDEAGIHRRQRIPVKPALGCRSGAPIVDQDVRGFGKLPGYAQIPVVAQIERRDLLSPVPHQVAGELARPIPPRRLDFYDFSAVVGEDHRGQRPAHPLAEIEYPQSPARRRGHSKRSGSERRSRRRLASHMFGRKYLW